MPLPQPKCSLSLRSGSNLAGLGNRLRVAVRRAVQEEDRRTLRDDGPTDFDVGQKRIGWERTDRRLETQDLLDGAGISSWPAAAEARRTRGSAARSARSGRSC